MRRSALFLLLVGASGCSRGVVLNDVHSRLNPTRVASVALPTSTAEVVEVVLRAKRERRAISVSGSRHAMGGQQFGKGTLHVSTSKLADVLAFDRERGLLRVEAGIEWPAIIAYLIESQKGQASSWGIVQKQTGADRLSLGGALSANAHGRGLRFKPIVQDVESFKLVDAEGRVVRVSRDENRELFGLAIGGYGLFGVITEIELRLMPRTKLRRVVEVVSLEALPEMARRLLAEGFLYGDYQYKTDESAVDFMRTGVLSAYRRVPAETAVPESQAELTRDRWYDLMLLAHVDKAKAFDLYSRYYLSTDGQVYWSDLHQTSEYLEDYVEYLRRVRPELGPGSLMITELYVPRDKATDFIRRVIEDSRRESLEVVYGTMRLIEKDDETLLAWAKRDYACIIFNLRVEHSGAGLEKARRAFRGLIDRALELEGSFYPTYHRWATREQWLKAFPRLPEFLQLKRRYDPEERFQSEWYRELGAMLAGESDAR